MSVVSNKQEYKEFEKTYRASLFRKTKVFFGETTGLEII